MAHRRKEIRDQVVLNLTGLSQTGGNVFKSRQYPLQSAELPGLCVYSLEEESEHGAAGGTLDRYLTIMIEATVKSSAGDIDDALDDIAEEIEAAFASDPKINGLAKNSLLIGTDFEFNKETEKPVGKMFVRFQIYYRT